MTVSTTQIRASYTGDGSSVNFPIPFPFYLATDLLVLQGGSVITSGYSISGGGSGTPLVPNTGTLTMATAPTAGQNLQIILNVPLTQLVNLVDGTAFPSGTINQVNDRAIQAAQRLNDILSRTISAPDGDVSPVMLLPAAAIRAGQMLTFDNNGNVLPAPQPVNGSITQSVVGQLLNPRTASEISASVTPANYAYPELHVKRYGAVCDGVTNDSTALHQADLVAGGSRSIIAVGVMNIASVTTVSSPLVDTLSQLFTTGSTVTLSGCPFVRPEWFGSATGNIRLAVNALPTSGGSIKLEKKTYPASYTTTPAKTDGTGVAGTDYLALNNVTLLGAGSPEYNGSKTGFIAGSGTIITGPFRVWAPGFKILGGLGVDSSASPNDAFFFYQPNEPSPTYASGVYIESVRGVGNGPTAAYHACLIEGATGVVVKEAQGYNCGHGVVSKSQFAAWGIIKAGLNQLDGFVFKADAYAQSHVCQVDEIQVVGSGAGSSNNGVIIEGVGATGDKCQIGRVFVTGCTYGVNITNGGNAITDVQIDEVISDGCTIATQIDNVQRCQIGKIIANNGSYAVFSTSNQGSKDVRVSEVVATNLVNDVIYAQGSIRVGNITLDATIGGYVVNFPTPANSAIRCMIDGEVTNAGVASLGFSNLNATLTNSWANFGSGNSNFGITLGGGMVRFSGLIHSGSAASLLTLSQPLWPALNLRLTALCYNGTTWAPGEVTVTSSTGVVAVTNYTAGSTYISLDGVQFPIPY